MLRHRALIYLFGAMILVSGGASACSFFGGGDDKQQPSGTTEVNEPGESSTTAPKRPGPEAFVLNEIRISGDAQFVELKNTGSGPASPSGLAVVTMSVRFALPQGLSDVAPGGVVVVHFDGKSGVDGANVHASARRAFADDGDEVALQFGETILDRAAWGDADGANVYLGTGGRARDPESGSIIARAVGASGAIAPWNFLGVDDGSPGEPNAAVGVSAFATMDGALFLTSPSLTWYSVPGAVSYEVEVAADGDFKSTLWKSTVTPSAPGALEQLSANPSGLVGQKFSWRVSVTYGDGSSAMSAVHTFRTLASAATSGTPATSSPAPSSTPAPSASPAGSGSPPGTPTAVATPVVKRVPGVRQVYQRKDTALLELENPTESGPLAWDKPDAEGTHDRPFCAAAAMAMMADFYGGVLQEMSIDRLRYEANLSDRPRPERDLPKWGMDDPEINRAAAWAFSPAPAYHQNNTVGKVLAFIAAIRTEIDAGRPMMASFPAHMFLIVGYTEDDGEGNFAFLFQDGNGIEMLISFDPRDLPSQDPNYPLPKSGVDVWWTFAEGTTVIDGGDMEADDDDDGVMDFDETNRFKTSPSNADSDSDGVPDKEEIRASTWDPKYGYLGQSGQFMPRDHDRDGLKMELDPDSDGGGCLDGMEDLDRDGHREEGETSVFEPDDDACVSGTFVARMDITHSQDGVVDWMWGETRATFALTEPAGGIVTGLASVTASFELRTTGGDPCPLYATGRHTVSWQADISGQAVAGTLHLSVDTAEPEYTADFAGCGSSSLISGQWPGFHLWWEPITFTDGRYDSRFDYPLRAGETGHFYDELQMVQPGR